MHSLGSSGVWETFVPNLGPGAKYKYEILDVHNGLRLKSDPYAVYFEGPPHNASIVYALDRYCWGDQKWLEERSKMRWYHAPISVYEVHLDSWRRVPEDHHRPLGYRELAVELGRYVSEMGFTHVELLPVAEHPFLGSWGYQVTGFFAPTSRYGTPEDFMYFVDSLHRQGIGVIVDWVPGHFPRDEFSLVRFDGTCLYEHADPRRGEHPDWGTLIFNYGRHEVRNFLLGSALSWLDRFHVDGLRVDAVASMLYLNYSRKDGEWLPNAYGGKENIEAIEFLRKTNDLVHADYPGVITIAEESTSFGGVSHSTREGGLGFDFKWNLGWMHDTLDYLSKDPVYRKHHHRYLTFGMLYQYSENFIQTFSHDECVHGKGSLIQKMGSHTLEDKAQTLRALYAYMWAWPGKKTLFMGDEFGQVAEWNETQSLDWHLCQYPLHRGIRRLVGDLNRLYRSYGFLAYNDYSPKGFSWIDPDDADHSVVSFIRTGSEMREVLLVLANFTPVMRSDYQVGVPRPGLWKEILNTDSEFYAGSNRGNYGGKASENRTHRGWPFSLTLCLPPLSTVWMHLS
jgi:1,4-alpha-glucan branching enzyme